MKANTIKIDKERKKRKKGGKCIFRIPRSFSILFVLAFSRLFKNEPSTVRFARLLLFFSSSCVFMNFISESINLCDIWISYTQQSVCCWVAPRRHAIWETFPFRNIRELKYLFWFVFFLTEPNRIHTRKERSGHIGLELNEKAATTATLMYNVEWEKPMLANVIQIKSNVNGFRVFERVCMTKMNAYPINI